VKKLENICLKPDENTTQFYDKSSIADTKNLSEFSVEDISKIRYIKR
jgi:hypothetical protein